MIAKTGMAEKCRKMYLVRRTLGPVFPRPKGIRWGFYIRRYCRWFRSSKCCLPSLHRCSVARADNCTVITSKRPFDKHSLSSQRLLANWHSMRKLQYTIGTVALWHGQTIHDWITSIEWHSIKTLIDSMALDFIWNCCRTTATTFEYIPKRFCRFYSNWISTGAAHRRPFSYQFPQFSPQKINHEFIHQAYTIDWMYLSKIGRCLHDTLSLWLHVRMCVLKCCC